MHLISELQIGRELGANPGTIKSKRKGNWHQHQRNETQQTVAPAKAEGIIHGQAGHGQKGSEQRSEDGEGSNNGGGILGIAVDEICLGRQLDFVSMRRPRVGSRLTVMPINPKVKTAIPIMGTIQCV